MSPQAAFARALLAPDQPCPEGVFSANGADPHSRFAVYRNNVHSAAINALVASYPVTRQLVGDAFFRAMAAVYVQAAPPTSPLMSEYGATLAAFIQGFEPAASVPYLADVARLERLRIRAFHAADTAPLNPQAVVRQLTAQTALGALRMRLHPSLAAFNSAYGSVAIWAAHQTEGAVAPFDPWHAQGALVLRQELSVKVFAIDAGSVTFINCLEQGSALEMAAAHALQASADFDLHACLSLLIRHDAITHLLPNPKESP